MENHGGNARPRRTLTPEQKRRILEKRRKAKLKKRLMILVPAAVVVLALVIVLLLVGGGENPDKENNAVDAAPQVLELQEAPEQQMEEEILPEGENALLSVEDAESESTGDATGTETGEDVGELEMDANMGASLTTKTASAGDFDYDTAYIQATQGITTGAEITYDYYSEIESDKLTRWPEAKEGFIPIVFKAKTEEKIIAVTVDDCFQGNNLMQIVQCAIDNDADLTIFPIAKNLDLDTVANALRYAYQNGHEIGNHTYNHAGMYHYNQERMQMEIWYQQMKVNETLGVNYSQNWFRPKGGDEREDQRVHAYLNQLGYSGVAIWTQSGSTDSLESLFNNLAPGRIYLFHTTNNDLNKLLQFIPGAVQRGYRLVTLSEMFGLPDPEVSELTLTTATEPPQLEAFNIKVPTLKKTAYIRAAAVVQQRLIDLGWLEGEADGVFGNSSYIATGLFQMEAGLPANGQANPETQKVLFSDDAPVATKEKIAALYKQLGKEAP